MCFGVFWLSKLTVAAFSTGFFKIPCQFCLRKPGLELRTFCMYASAPAIGVFFDTFSKSIATDLLYMIHTFSFVMAFLAVYTSTSTVGHLQKQMPQPRPNQTATDLFYVVNISSFVMAFLAM